MKGDRLLFSFSRNLDSALAAVAGLFIILIFCRHSGIGISPDSVTYLATARNISGGRGFLSYTQLPMVDFPLGYPMFLALISWISGLDALIFAPLANGILFAILLYTSGAMMNGFEITSGWYKRIVLACLVFSPVLQEVYSMLWSETLFLILILLFILCLSKYIKKPDNRLLMILSVICTMACLIRYAGIFLLCTGFFILLSTPGRPYRKRIYAAVVFGMLSGGFLLVNLVRNKTLSGVVTGIRPPSHSGIIANTENIGVVLASWFGLPSSPGFALVWVAAAMTVFIIALKKLFRRSEQSLEFTAAATGLVYIVFMVSTATLTRYELFNNRLASPILIPLLWSSSYWVPKALSAAQGKRKVIAGLILLIASACFLNRQLAADYEYYDGVKDAGIPGYQEDSFTQSEIVQYLRKNVSAFNPAFPVYSNAADAVYFITGIPARPLPFQDFPVQLDTYYKSATGYLIWFSDDEDDRIPGLKEIMMHKKMQPVVRLHDGAVYTGNQ